MLTKSFFAQVAPGICYSIIENHVKDSDKTKININFIRGVYFTNTTCDEVSKSYINLQLITEGYFYSSGIRSRMIIYQKGLDIEQLFDRSGKLLSTSHTFVKTLDDRYIQGEVSVSIDNAMTVYNEHIHPMELLEYS